jgi:hypothetical protein
MRPRRNGCEQQHRENDQNRDHLFFSLELQTPICDHNSTAATRTCLFNNARRDRHPCRRMAPHLVCAARDCVGHAVKGAMTIPREFVAR